MCTATWSIGESGYRLAFNRDERRTRLPAALPRTRTDDQATLLFPLDQAAGGTWIAVNDFGVTVCLLNYYSATINQSALGRVSRGAIPLRLCREPSLDKAEQVLRSMPLRDFAPFMACLFAAGREPLAAIWEGRKLEWSVPSEGILTTSSFRSSEVEAYRRELFASRVGAGVAEEAAQVAFHANAEHPDPAFRPMMTREDAFTQSLALVHVGNDEIAMEYRERAKHESGFEEGVRSHLTPASALP